MQPPDKPINEKPVAVSRKGVEVLIMLRVRADLWQIPREQWNDDVSLMVYGYVVPHLPPGIVPVERTAQLVGFCELEPDPAPVAMPPREALEQLERENAILKLAVPLEEDLSASIDEMCKYLAMEQGFTLAGIARLLNECQRRMAADWVEIGRMRGERAAVRDAAPASSVDWPFVADRIWRRLADYLVDPRITAEGEDADMCRSIIVEELQETGRTPVEFDTTCDNDIGRSCRELWPMSPTSWCEGCLHAVVEEAARMRAELAAGRDATPVRLVKRDLAPKLKMTEALYKADLDQMFLAADGSMMCEAHPGREWPHDDCAGPGMPWTISGRMLIEEMLAVARDALEAGRTPAGAREKCPTHTGETMIHNILSRHILDAGQEMLLRFPNDHPFVETRTLDGAIAGCYLCGGEPEIHRTRLLPLPDRCPRHDVTLNEAHECALCAAEDLAHDLAQDARDA